MKKHFLKGKKADIWISTVLYTLISLAIIGTLLGVVRPRIDEMRDHYLIDQTIGALNQIDKTVTSVKTAQGMRLPVEFQLSRGILIFNTTSKIIQWSLPDSRYQYSETGFPVSIGKLSLKTSNTSSDRWNILVQLNYSDIIFTVNNQSIPKTYQSSSRVYSIWAENKGTDPATSMLKIDFGLE